MQYFLVQTHYLMLKSRHIVQWKHAIISIIKRFTNQELNLQIESEIPSVYIQFHNWSAAAYSNKSYLKKTKKWIKSTIDNLGIHIMFD